MKTYLFFPIALVITISFFSCSRSPEKIIIGKWLSINGKGSVELTKDGTFLMYVDTNIVSARYKFLDDGKVLIEYLGGSSAKKISVSFSDDNDKMFTKDESNNKSQSFLRIDDLPYSEYGNFSEGLAKVKLENLFGFINTSAKQVIKPQYDEGADFKDGLSKVKKGDKYGFINTSGTEVVPFIFNNIDYAFKGEINDYNIMNYLYGNYNGVYSKWVTNHTKDDPKVVEFAGGRPFYTKIKLLDSMKTENMQNYVLVTISKSQNQDDCWYLSSAYIFIKFFDKVFLRVDSDLLWEETLCRGIIATRIFKIGKNKLGLGLEDVFIDDWGTTSERTYIYSEYKGKFKRSVMIETSENNSLKKRPRGNPLNFRDLENDPFWGWKATYNFIENKTTEYFDLVVKTQGTEYNVDPNRLDEINKEEIHKFIDGKYVKK